MNLRDLELFQHLSASLHFGRTAIDCNITPSGLTRAIQRLENEIGASLFYRDNRNVRLTPAGKLFCTYTQETLLRFQQFKNTLQSDSTICGQLRLYCSVTAALSILPRILKVFRLLHPGVVIHIQTGDPARALARLHNGDVDVCIAALPDHIPAELDFLTLEETPLLFIAPKFFPETLRYRNGTIDWHRTPVILPATGLSRIRAERWFAQKEIQPYIYAEAAGNEAIIALVSMGAGVGVAPRLVLEKSPLLQEIETVSISPPLEPFVVSACTIKHHKRTPVIKAFWETISREKEQGPSL